MVNSTLLVNWKDDLCRNLQCMEKNLSKLSMKSFLDSNEVKTEA